MKILNFLSNFIWLFIVIGIVLVKLLFFDSENTPHEPFSWNKFTYNVGEYVISLVLTAVILFCVYKVAEWIIDKRQSNKSKL